MKKAQVVHYGTKDGILCQASLNPKLPRTLNIDAVTCGSCHSRPRTVVLGSPGAATLFREEVRQIGVANKAALAEQAAWEAEVAALLPQIGHPIHAIQEMVVLLDGTTLRPQRGPVAVRFHVSRPHLDADEPYTSSYSWMSLQEVQALAASIGMAGTEKEAKAILEKRAVDEDAVMEAIMAKAAAERAVAKVNPDRIHRKVMQELTPAEQAWHEQKRAVEEEEKEAVKRVVLAVRDGIMIEEIDQELDAEDRGDFSHRRH